MNKNKLLKVFDTQ